MPKITTYDKFDIHYDMIKWFSSLDYSFTQDLKSFSNKKISALSFIISTAESTEIEISYSFMAGVQ